MPLQDTDPTPSFGGFGLSPKQERQRIEGLRMLARIIARHYLANPELYANGAAGGRDASAVNGPPPADRQTTQEEGAA